MQLREVAAISGKPGLYRILKPASSGVIVESIDDKKTRMVAGGASKVSVLSEISIYTTDAEGQVPLPIVLLSVFEKFAGKPVPLSAKSDGADLEDFLLSVVPDADTERVYTSDIKKLAGWYNILAQHTPELFGTLKEVPSGEDVTAAPATEEAVAEETKPKVKKAKAPKEETGSEAVVAPTEETKPKKPRKKAE